jgi:hypothetical protein
MVNRGHRIADIFICAKDVQKVSLFDILYISEDSFIFMMKEDGFFVKQSPVPMAEACLLGTF